MAAHFEPIRNAAWLRGRASCCAVYGDSDHAFEASLARLLCTWQRPFTASFPTLLHWMRIAEMRCANNTGDSEAHLSPAIF